nr:hypothetical protein [Pseudopedobacter sp.]
MKKLIILLLVICMVQISFAQQKENGIPNAAPEITQATYTCPMHPEIHSSKPGNCPKCGMKLVVDKPKVTAPVLKEKMQMPAK